jgi:hypothetical protein
MTKYYPQVWHVHVLYYLYLILANSAKLLQSKSKKVQTFKMQGHLTARLKG